MSNQASIDQALQGPWNKEEFEPNPELDNIAREWLTKYSELSRTASQHMMMAYQHTQSQKQCEAESVALNNERDKLSEKLQAQAAQETPTGFFGRIKAMFGGGPDPEVEKTRLEDQKRLGELSQAVFQEGASADLHRRVTGGYVAEHARTQDALEKHIEKASPEVRQRAVLLGRQDMAQAAPPMASEETQTAKEWLNKRTEFRQSMTDMADKVATLSRQLGDSIHKHGDDLTDEQKERLVKAQTLMANQSSELRDAAVLMTLNTQDSEKKGVFIPPQEAVYAMEQAERRLNMGQDMLESVPAAAQLNIDNKPEEKVTVLQQWWPEHGQGDQRAAAASKSGMSM